MATATQIGTLTAATGAETPVARRRESTNEIARPFECFVIGCREAILRDGTGSALVVDHKRFGRVHTCSGHNPNGRDRY